MLHENKSLFPFFESFEGCFLSLYLARVVLIRHLGRWCVQKAPICVDFLDCFLQPLWEQFVGAMVEERCPVGCVLLLEESPYGHIKNCFVVIPFLLRWLTWHLMTRHRVEVNDAFSSNMWHDVFNRSTHNCCSWSGSLLSLVIIIKRGHQHN